MRDELTWSLVAAGSAAAASVMVRKGTRSGWRRALKKEPPDNPAAPDVRWREAVLWSLATGVLIGLSRLTARRLAAKGWRRAFGRLPPI